MDLSSLSAQIASACQFALSPSSAPSQRQEAYTFLQRVREAHGETWQACLALFLERNDAGAGAGGDATGYKWDGDARMFGVQVVGESASSAPLDDDHAIILPHLSHDALAFVQQSLVDYFQQEYITHGKAENGVAYLKNASVHLITILFVHTYPQQFSSFFSTFLNLLRLYSPSHQPAPTTPPPLNPMTTDLLLRLLHDVSDEISDAQLRLNKLPHRLAKDTELRDAVREHDAPAIASSIWEIISESLDGISTPSSSSTTLDDLVGLKGKRARDILEMAMRVVGDYVSWIDINLMVTPSTIALLLRALNLPSTSDDLSIRTAAADALLETISKGMPPSDKLALLSVLDIASVLGRLVEERDASISQLANGKTVAGTSSEDEMDAFAEKFAKLLNGVGCELCKICEDNNASNEAKSAAVASTSSLFPLLLRLLTDSNDQVAIAVMPFTHTLLSLYKKDKKRSQGAPLDPERRVFLTALLKAAIVKMQYKPDAEWTLSKEGEEDDDELAFLDMRKNLRQIGDAIAILDAQLYSDVVQSTIVSTIETFEQGATLPWQRFELSLYLLYGFGQAILVTGPLAFSVVPQAEIDRAKKEAEYRVDYTAFPLSTLGELLHRACRANIVEFPHPSVALQFFEITVRYSDFFKLCPEFIGRILPSFLDEHGLHQTDETIQARMFYLFSRFIHQAKHIVQTRVSGQVIQEILSRMQDLLTINAELDPSEASVESLVKAASTTTFFDAQLYLLESIGTLIWILNQMPDEQVTLLRAVLTPLLSELQANVRPTASTAADYASVLKAHHLIMATGNVAKGFPDATILKVTPTDTPRGGSPGSSGPSANISAAMARSVSGVWVEVFKEATESMLAVAKSMSSFVVIRDAVRFSFNRIVATTGPAVLHLIPTLIDVLLGEITFPELAELLSFVGLLVAKYKNSIVEVLDTLLLPVFNRVFHFLKQPITGTDDEIQHATLRRAYFNFILSITSSNLQQVVYSESELIRCSVCGARCRKCANSPTFAENKSSISSILSSVTHYIALDNAQISDQRLGFILLTKLLTLWVVPPPTPATNAASGQPNNSVLVIEESPVPGFERFLYTSAIPICFQVPLDPTFDLLDAQSFQMMGEIASLLKGLHLKRGDEFVQFMMAEYLPTTNTWWPQGAAQEILNEITNAKDGKTLKKPLCEWVKKMRRALAQAREGATNNNIEA
ncbi:BQ2448_7559 [Microbotryum intermedium]|uniref:Exportin-T n=1 Tax=Microbotryum intermedium TaxID=269621 RepID=A0A238FL78_9BASI|nr:BQ2448_7559 [Microbotryum intermedium]